MSSRYLLFNNDVSTFIHIFTFLNLSIFLYRADTVFIVGVIAGAFTCFASSVFRSKLSKLVPQVEHQCFSIQAFQTSSPGRTHRDFRRFQMIFCINVWSQFFLLIQISRLFFISYFLLKLTSYYSNIYYYSLFILSF